MIADLFQKRLGGLPIEQRKGYTQHQNVCTDKIKNKPHIGRMLLQRCEEWTSEFHAGTSVIITAELINCRFIIAYRTFPSSESFIFEVVLFLGSS
ncbi:hypothetical protein D3C75_761380 [compost metagenome]